MNETWRINEIVEDIFPELVEIRRKIHQYPEIAYNEKRTSQLIFEYLQKIGIEAEAGIAKTGAKGLIKGNEKRITVGLRADMDALPVNEQNECDYKSKIPGMMHACGHDVHVTCLLGAAYVLSKLKDRLNGNIRLIFQPAEEGVGGAMQMIKEGILDNPRVAACAALHVSPDLPAGHIGVHYGPAYSSRDSFEIIIKGKGGHGAMPHLSVDPIIVGAQLVIALPVIIRQRINAVKPVIVSICSFQAGNTENVIPDIAVIKGTVRMTDNETKEKMPELMEKIISGITSGSGAAYELIYKEGYPATVNDDNLTDILVASAAKIVGNDNIKTYSNTMMVSEDFSCYAQVVPGTIFQLGCRNEEKKIIYPLHNAKFNVDEECIKTGVAVLAQFACDYLDGMNE